MEREEIILTLKDFFKKNASKYHIEIVFLYGSWTSGYPRPDSDVDLGILFDTKIEDRQKIFFLITDITYELDKKMNREVNIVPILKDFPWPMLYYNIIILGTPVFIKDDDKFLSLKLEAIHQMEDFQLFGVPWQREIAQKLLTGR